MLQLAVQGFLKHCIENFDTSCIMAQISSKDHVN